MAQTTSDVLAERLIDWGVDTVFGIPGLEPPMPGKIGLDQAAMFARSLVRGEPNRMHIALTAVSDKVRELV